MENMQPFWSGELAATRWEGVSDSPGVVSHLFSAKSLVARAATANANAGMNHSYLERAENASSRLPSVLHLKMPHLA